MSRQSEFQLFPALWLVGTSEAKAKKGAVCPSDPPYKWEGAVVQWLLLITTKQLQTHRATAKGPSHTAGPGDKPYSVGRPQAARCTSCNTQFTPTPWGPRCGPELLLPHQLLWLKLQGGKGIMSVNATALTKKCHGPCSAGWDFGEGGMSVQILAHHDSCWTFPRRKTEKNCNRQIDTEKHVKIQKHILKQS